jgi:hypothetical protein
MKALSAALVATTMSLSAGAHANGLSMSQFMQLLPCTCGEATAMAISPYQNVLRAAPAAFKAEFYPVNPDDFFNVFYNEPGKEGAPQPLCSIGDQYPQGANPTFPYIGIDSGKTAYYLTWWAALRFALQKTYESSCWSHVTKIIP